MTPTPRAIFIPLLFNLYRGLKVATALPAAALGLPPHACRHNPSCSHYCQQALLTKGILVGSRDCLRRLVSCRPSLKKK